MLALNFERMPKTPLAYARGSIWSRDRQGAESSGRSRASARLNQQIQPALELVQRAHDLVMLHLIGRRRLALNIERPAGLEDAVVHLVDGVEPLAVEHGGQFGMRQQLLRERVLAHSSFLDQ